MSTAGRKQATAGTADKLAILRRHRLFGRLSQTAVEHLAFYTKRRSLPRGTVVFARGEPGTGLMGVLAGAVKISVPSANGREIVLGIMREGDIFGEIALIDGRPHTTNATALTDCDLTVIEFRDFLQFLRSQPNLAIQIIEILCTRLRRRTEQVQDRTFLNLPTRLAKTLLQLTADVERSSVSAAKLTVTQREISQIIGRSRQSTNQQLRSWAKQGIIHLERGVVVVLNRDKLADVAAQGFGFNPS